MNLLREIYDTNIFPDTQNHDPATFTEKATSRIVLLNNLGHIALLRVGKYNYHKLPGGGIENNESPEQALHRELLEEMGCRARIIAEVGVIIEYKNEQRRRQTSYCYLGEQEGEVISRHLTESELAHDYTEVWLHDIDAAITQVAADQPIGYSRKFIQARELEFLRAAKTIIPDYY